MSVISMPAVCRACLSSNIYVCPATQEYIDQFVSLTKLTIQESDGKPLGLCHTCCYYIRKYHKFQERCLQADAILNQHNLLHAENYIGEDFNLMGLTPELRCTPVTIIDVTQEHSQLLTNLEVKQERGALTYDEVGVKFEASEDILSAGYVEPLAETVVMPVITNTFENVRELWKDPLSNDTLDSMHDGSKNVLQILDLVQQSDSLGELKNEPDHETRYQSEDIELIHESVSQNETQYSPQRLDFSPNKLKSEGVNSASQELLPKGSQKYNIGGNIFQCPVCERKFNSHSKLKQHLRKLTHNTHTGEKPFQCEVCDRRFKYKCNLKQHLITHTGERPYQCSVCEKSFYKKSKLNQHLITHTGVKPYQCSVCDKRFYVKSYLNQHLITHTEEKPYQCSMCQKTFYTKDKLNRHLVTHTGDRPYQCLVCEKRFKMKSHLKDHVRTHTGKKLYQCEVCDKRFNCKSYLKKHLVRHTGQRQFQCLVCEKRFNCKSDLKHHVMTHTGE